MAQEKPNRIVEWVLLVRKQWPVARGHFSDWLSAVREEPALIWQTVAVRYATYGLSALVGILLLVKLVGVITPPLPASARPAATTADFHVVCSNASCGHHFVINRKFRFRGFPVPCPQCKQTMGVQARKCTTTSCQGQWVAPEERGGVLVCPRCGRPF